jgi:hypothetical protein
MFLSINFTFSKHGNGGNGKLNVGKKEWNEWKTNVEKRGKGVTMQKHSEIWKRIGKNGWEKENRKKGFGRRKDLTLTYMRRWHDSHVWGRGSGVADPEERCTRTPDSGSGHTPARDKAKGAGGLDTKCMEAFIKICNRACVVSMMHGQKIK